MNRVSAISGSHGFIGGHLLRHLERLGHKVKRIERDGSFKGDASWIFDCGAYGNLFGQDSVEETIKANVMKLQNILNKKKFESLIYLSSSSVSLPTQTAYSLTKGMSEEIIKDWVKRTESPCVIVRPYTIIGTHEPDIHLMPKLIKSCLFKEKMPFVPAPVHDFLDVRDLVEALILIAENANKYKGEIFEIGSGIARANWEVKELVEDICGGSANIEIVDSLRPYDNRDWVADISKISKLGWKPKNTLKQTIFSMVSEYLPGL